jgi:error-prone DNA polymerase
MTAFAELVAATNFSFLTGASHAHEIVVRAAELGLAAVGIADRNSLAGVVRAHVAAKDVGIRMLVGARLVTTDGFAAACYPTDRAAYGRLCRLLTDGNRRSPKGECRISLAEVLAASEGQTFIVIPPSALDTAFVADLTTLARKAPGRTYLAASFPYAGNERRRLGELSELARRTGTRLVATNDVLYHTPERRPLADVLTCIREKCTITEAGLRLAPNAERHLKSGAEMARLFAAYPEAIANALAIVKSIDFSLDELKYEYPNEPVPPGKTAQGYLEELTWEHAARCFPDGVPDKVAALIDKELALVARLGYAHYFLTVYDIVRFAKEKDILCQGRGSAANSVVCYCLGITAVDPTKIDLLFERFISAERGEPPDIDVDFEHERREEVIQHLYDRYGRERAAICATVIHYRSRMAIRDVGKAMGLKDDVTAALANTVWGSNGEPIPDKHIREAGLDPANPAIRQAVDLTATLLGFPRHLSQHVGGFVLTRERLDETIPIHNGAMKDRTFIEWDKDDIDALKILKVDVLALGMLTAIRKAFDLIALHYGEQLSLTSVPQDDKDVYAMLSRADSIGVFQVESRAQMSMLPRLKPKEFYDLVIEVAIVRPGPIQGDMVHPYLRRREKIEPVSYPSEELEAVLSKTLGVPLFQEQAMQIAIVGAGFTPDEADKLRRAMATFRHAGTIHTFRAKFIAGMLKNGYEQDFAKRCFDQIEGFGEYGFPESHAASFALLVYVSAWIKHHYPEAFCAGLLNSQPMGFYQPAQLVRDAREHDVEVRPPDVNCSDEDCTLEPASDSTRCAVRLGLRLVDGLPEKHVKAIMGARGNGYGDMQALWRLSGVPVSALERLADADAFRSIGLDRREALWAVKGLNGGTLEAATATAADAPILTWSGRDDLFDEPAVSLPPVTLAEHVARDYIAIGLSLKAHPCAFFRERLARRGIITSRQHWDEKRANKRVTVAGLVLVRQRPGTSKGVIFLTLEDETGIVNVVVWPKVFERNRRTVMTAKFLAVRGRIQREGLVIHVVAEQLIDITQELHSMFDGDAVHAAPVDAARDATQAPRLKSRDFH